MAERLNKVIGLLEAGKVPFSEHGQDLVSVNLAVFSLGLAGILGKLSGRPAPVDRVRRAGLGGIRRHP